MTELEIKPEFTDIVSAPVKLGGAVAAAASTAAAGAAGSRPTVLSQERGGTERNFILEINQINY